MSKSLVLGLDWYQSIDREKRNWDRGLQVKERLHYLVCLWRTRIEKNVIKKREGKVKKNRKLKKEIKIERAVDKRETKKQWQYWE